MNRESKLLCIAATLVTLMPLCAPSAPPQYTTDKHTAIKPALLVSGLEGTLGSTIGPDGALYVPEGTAGRIARIDVETGAVTTFASGLPKSAIGVGGGAMDIAFLGETAYVLITLVNPLVGGNDIDGIYRVDGPNSFTVVADIGRWSVAHPPKPGFEIEVATGSTYAMETYHGELLVTDSHLNRVLRIKVAGCVSSPPPDDSNISELIAFGDVVPTGLAIAGHTIYMAEAGPLPNQPKDGKIVEFEFRHPVATEVASGAPQLVDVEFGPHHHLYGLSHGLWGGGVPGDPGLPNTGSLVRVNDDGGFTLIADHLDRPTSLEFIGNTAYYVSLAGEVWKIEGISCGHRYH
jgi:hypothetical protein